jgi:hypothetical protein
MAEVSGQFIYSEELYGLPARTVILIPVRWADLPEAETSLLDKILSAARLSLAGVQVVSTEKVSLSELAIYNPSLVISFGVKLDPETTLYEPKFEGNVTIIRSDRLGDLDDARKKNLWTALKQLLSR